MSNYGCYITSIIHNTNKFRPLRKAILNYNDMDTIIRGHKTFNFSETRPHIYRQADAGLYTCEFEDDEPGKFYIVNVFYPIKTAHNGTRIAVYNPTQIEYRTQNNLYPIIAHEIDKQIPITDSIEIEDSIDSMFNTIVLTGKSIYEDREPSIDDPIIIVNRNNIILESMSADETKHDVLVLDNAPDLLSLPSGERDHMVVDAYTNKAYVIKNCDGCRITGDRIERVDAYTPHDESHYVFFVKNEAARFVKDIDNIVCTHFKTVKFDTLINKDYKENCIAISNDWKYRHEGFFIKIESDIAKTETDLLSLINREILNNTPIEVIYPLMNKHYQIVILNRYELKTYFGGTTMIIPDYYGASCCYNAYKEA